MRNQRCVGCFVCLSSVYEPVNTCTAQVWLAELVCRLLICKKSRRRDRNDLANGTTEQRPARPAAVHLALGAQPRTEQQKEEKNKQINKQDMQQFHQSLSRGLRKSHDESRIIFQLRVGARVQPCELLCQIPFYFSSRASTLNLARRCERWRP